MELISFKDELEKLLKKSGNMDIVEMKSDNTVGVFNVKTTDGSVFTLECRKTDRQVFITVEESMKCRKVADAYTELYEQDNIVVLNAGRYGYVKLQYYNPRLGFDDTTTFTDSRTMFEDLWEEWLNSRLIYLSENTPMADMDYAEIFQCLPKEKQEELMQKKKYFAEKADIVIS